MLLGLVMDRSLSVDLLLWRAERVFGDKLVIARDARDELKSRRYADIAHRVRRLSGGLRALGVEPGHRVATMCWNTIEHLEVYFATPALGAVVHAINFRLRPEQVLGTLLRGGARVVVVDHDQLELLAAIADGLPDLEHVVVAQGVPGTDRIGAASVHLYEDLVLGSAPVEPVEVDERAAAALCFTSATTGEPKGILYSHRSLVLHSMQLSAHDGYGVREAMRVAAVSPMFHSNGWGVPYAAALQGATLILPGPRPDAESLVALVHRTSATHLNAAVTIGVAIRDWAREQDVAEQLRSLHEMWLGGQAPTPALIKWFSENVGAEVFQGWGLTETAVITFNRPSAAEREQLTAEELFQLGVRQGAPGPLAEIDLVDETGARLPWDGKSVGEYVVRGPAVVGAYWEDPERSAKALHDGWLLTGDLGVIDPDGNLRVLDRRGDMIKSGGEWIPPRDLENRLSMHPKVADVAVVGIPDEKWVERPAAWIVPTDPADPPTSEELRAFLAESCERWWIPDRFDIVAALPRTGVGKTDKRTIRSLARDGSTSS